MTPVDVEGVSLGRVLHQHRTVHQQSILAINRFYQI